MPTRPDAEVELSVRTMLQIPSGVHRRYNALTREWILVSARRAARPWKGEIETVQAETRPRHDPGCYLCPGNSRASGEHNPQYTETFVFDNDFPALLPNAPGVDQATLVQSPLLIHHPERGICRVICWSPRHDLTLAELDVQQIRRVIDVWVQQYVELGVLPFINHVQIFENKGEMMGASNPHPHGQIWANETVPTELLKEDESQRDYLAESGRCLLCDYLAQERDVQQRIVLENDDFVVLVPFWAAWPFETMLLSKRHVPSLAHLHDREKDALAAVLQRITVRYDNLFHTSFPYSMGFHQQPTDGESHPGWHLHAHFFPPLLRSATVRKFMVGYELLAQVQRDLTAEDAADALRGLPDLHYKQADTPGSRGSCG